MWYLLLSVLRLSLMSFHKYKWRVNKKLDNKMFLQSTSSTTTMRTTPIYHITLVWPKTSHRQDHNHSQWKYHQQQQKPATTPSSPVSLSLYHRSRIHMTESIFLFCFVLCNPLTNDDYDVGNDNDNHTSTTRTTTSWFIVCGQWRQAVGKGLWILECALEVTSVWKLFRVQHRANLNYTKPI